MRGEKNPILFCPLLFRIGLFFSSLFKSVPASFLLPFQLRLGPYPQSLPVPLLFLPSVNRPSDLLSLAPSRPPVPCAHSPLSPLSLPPLTPLTTPFSLHNLRCLLDCPDYLSHLPLKGFHSSTVILVLALNPLKLICLP